MTVETNGFLISNAASIPIRSVSNNKYVYQFDNCYETKSSESFSQSGDSGAIVFVHVQDCHERTKNPFGITIAFSADGTTCACQIDQIVQAFNLLIYQEEEDMDTQDD